MASKKVTLISSDGKEFVIDEAVALESRTIRHMKEVKCVQQQDAIPLANVTGQILSMVIKYCKKHVEIKNSGGQSSSSGCNHDLKKWEAKFMNVDTDTLYFLILASNYLDIKGLLELSCQTAADILKGKNPEKIRKIFNIKSDFTPEQEEEMRRENQWMFQ